MECFSWSGTTPLALVRQTLACYYIQLLYMFMSLKDKAFATAVSLATQFPGSRASPSGSPVQLKGQHNGDGQDPQEVALATVFLAFKVADQLGALNVAMSPFWLWDVCSLWVVVAAPGDGTCPAPRPPKRTAMLRTPSTQPSMGPCFNGCRVRGEADAPSHPTRSLRACSTGLSHLLSLECVFARCAHRAPDEESKTRAGRAGPPGRHCVLND